MTGAGAGWRVERLTRAADLDAVAALEASSFRRPSQRDLLERALQGSDVTRVYVLRTPERPVAAFCVCWVIVDELHVNTVAVDEACRRQGMAAHLMRHVLADAATSGATRATLEVRESNRAARRLYETLGFTVAGIRRAYYTDPDEDGLILWRQATGPPASHG